MDSDPADWGVDLLRRGTLQLIKFSVDRSIVGAYQAKFEIDSDMHIISTPQIHAVIREIRPTHIAVAYLGADWGSLIDAEFLNEIVVSPTLGTNPHAVEQIVRHLGWENVHFLESLHSKIYIGECAAAVGSFNLSRNGICTTGLEETGVYLNERLSIDEAKSEYNRLRSLAISAYPSEDTKKKRLQRLKKEHGLALTKGVVQSPRVENSLQRYTVLSDRDFYVCWWQPGDINFDKDSVQRVAPEAVEWNFDTEHVDFTNVLASDCLEEGDWLLMWRAKVNGLPHKTEQMTWLYVDKVVERGVRGCDYSKLALEIKNLPHPNPPFDIKPPKVQSALKQAIALSTFTALQAAGAEAWSIEASANSLAAYLHAARRLLADSA